MANLLTDLPDSAIEEVFTSLIDRPGVRIERIVSMGQTTSADTPYDQPHDEWVLLLAGEARLRIERQGERLLVSGEPY